VIIKSDMLHIQHHSAADDGSKIEPEQQPAQRVIEADGEVEMRSGGVVGSMPVRIISDMTAGSLAMVVRSRCRTCKNFDRTSWRKMVRKADEVDAPAIEKASAMMVRDALLMTDNADVIDANTVSPTEPDFDVEAALNSMGICHALTEFKRDLIVVHPLSGCPTEVATPERQEGFYTPRSNEAERLAQAKYDEVMRAAQGYKDGKL